MNEGGKFHCSRCGGKLFLAPDNDRGLQQAWQWECLNCGNITPMLENVEQPKMDKEGGNTMIDPNKPAALPEVPERPDLSGISARRKQGEIIREWCEEHQELLTRYIKRLGPTKTTKLWRISSGSMARIQDDWGLPVRKYTTDRNYQAGNLNNSDAAEKEPPPSLVEKPLPIYKERSLPSFPEFDPKWNDIVQCEWLRQYGLMMAAGK